MVGFYSNTKLHGEIASFSDAATFFITRSVKYPQQSLSRLGLIVLRTAPIRAVGQHLRKAITRVSEQVVDVRVTCSD